MSVHISRIAKDAPQPTVQMSADERTAFKIQWKYITQKLKATGCDFSGIKIVKKEG